jgi:hypothetical protein
VGPIHRLHIFGRVPIVINEDHSIRPRQRQSQSSYARRQQEHIDARIGIKGLDDVVSFHGFRTSVQTHERYAGHVRDEELILDDVQHLAGLAEDQDAVL